MYHSAIVPESGAELALVIAPEGHMSNPLLLIGALLALAILYVVIPVAVDGVMRFRKGVRVTCPETGQPLDVHVTAMSAAASSFRGPGKLRVVSCPRWPERAACDRMCTSPV
jgi:hypothetical protein